MLTKIGGVALLIQRIIVRAGWQHEFLVTHPPQQALFILSELLLVLLIMVAPHIRNVFQEQHHQNVVLMLRRVHRPAKRVAGLPENGIDFVLRDSVGLSLHSNDYCTALKLICL